ncbi:hypothetical protein TNCV_4807461 [Trichonephila clavipes]|nr:hypothetical protein TNCV_4807461 [Trichonephila clavipes]
MYFKSLETQSPPVSVVWKRDGLAQEGVSHLDGIVVSDAECCVPYNLGSNPGEGMDVCKCIVPVWHGGTQNIHRDESLLESSVVEVEHPQGCSFSKLRVDGDKTCCHLHGAQSYE